MEKPFQRENTLKIFAAAMGILVLSLQILFIRTVLQLFQGNELTIGVALSVWLLGTSAGSLLYSSIFRGKGLWHAPLLLLFPIFISELILIKILPLLFDFIPGVPLGIPRTAGIILMTILPVAFLSGTLFPYIIQVLPGTKNSHMAHYIQSVYIWESVGALLASLLLSFVLLYILSDFQLMALFLIIFYSVCLWIFSKHQKRPVLKYFLYLYVILAGVIFISGNSLNRKIHQIVFRPYQVTEEVNTPYGNMKRLELEAQTTILNQGTIAYTLPDHYHAEAAILLPLLCHPCPQNVLIIGGNLSDYLAWITRFPSIEKIYYVEKDPYLIDLQKKLIDDGVDTLNAELEFIMDDVRRILQSREISFDLVILNKPEPFTLSDNRFYTVEFYQLVKSHLRDDGLFCFSIRSSENYLNPPLAAYIFLLKNSLHSVFSVIFDIPGNDHIFLISEGLDIKRQMDSFPDRLQSLHLEPQYFSTAFLKYRTSAERLERFHQQLVKLAHDQWNKDFNLKGYLYHFRLWQSITDPQFVGVLDRFARHRSFLFLLILFMFIGTHFSMGRHHKSRLLWSLFLVGGFSIALEIIFLLEYQILFGTLYSTLAIIFGLFMLGLAMGASVAKTMIFRFPEIHWERFWIAGFIFLCLVLYLPTSKLMPQSLTSFHSLALKGFIGPLLIFLNGGLTGGYFSLMTSQFYRLSPSASAGVTYGFDLAGSVVAAFMVSIILIPVFEIRGVLFLMLFFMTVQLVWRGK